MDGRLLTLDAATGNALWREEFGSLIVNVYLLNAEGMYKLRTQAVGAETFDAMLEVRFINEHVPVSTHEYRGNRSTKKQRAIMSKGKERKTETIELQERKDKRLRDQ